MSDLRVGESRECDTIDRIRHLSAFLCSGLDRYEFWVNVKQQQILGLTINFHAKLSCPRSDHITLNLRS